MLHSRAISALNDDDDDDDDDGRTLGSGFIRCLRLPLVRCLR